MILRPDGSWRRIFPPLTLSGRELRSDVNVARCRWIEEQFQAGVGGTNTTGEKTVDIALVRPVCRVGDLTSNPFSFIFRRGCQKGDMVPIPGANRRD